MKKLYLVIISLLSIFLLMGCGNSNKQTSEKNPLTTNVKNSFSYFRYGELKKDTNTTICFKGLYGDYYKIYMDKPAYEQLITFYIESYRLMDCSGLPIHDAYSAYSYEFGNESNDSKSIGITLTNVSYNTQKDFEIEKMVSKKIFGKVILDQPFYTIVVASGNLRKEKIRLGFAQSTINLDGSSSEKRANNISLFTDAQLYFMEQIQ